MCLVVPMLTVRQYTYCCSCKQKANMMRRGRSNDRKAFASANMHVNYSFSRGDEQLS